MTQTSQPAARIRTRQRKARADLFVPVVIGVLGLITATLILLAFGILVGLVQF